MWTIYLKDIRELLRDYKTFVFTVLIPVFALPIFMFGFGYVAAKLSDSAQSAEIKYAIAGAENSPSLHLRFSSEKGFREVKLDPGTTMRAAIEDGQVRFVLVIPPHFDGLVNANKQNHVRLHFNSAASGDITRRRVAAVIDDYNTRLREKAVQSLGMTHSELTFVVKPVQVDEHSTANERERIGAIVGGILPYFLLLVCLMAAMYPAIDLGAGEKENGTLETLLLAPLDRSELVMGKFMVLFSIGLTSALLMVLSMGVLFGVFGVTMDRDLAAIAASIGAGDLFMVALMLVPTSAIFAALLLSMSIYAKSYKEASGMMQPMLLLTIFPVLLAMLPGVQLNWFWAAVPLTNIALAMKDVVKGTLDYRMLLIILGSTCAIAGLLLSWCRWWFNREEVLFRN